MRNTFFYRNFKKYFILIYSPFTNSIEKFIKNLINNFCLQFHERFQKFLPQIKILFMNFKSSFMEMDGNKQKIPICNPLLIIYTRRRFRKHFIAKLFLICFEEGWGTKKIGFKKFLLHNSRTFPSAHFSSSAPPGISDIILLSSGFTLFIIFCLKIHLSLKFKAFLA